MLNFDRAFNQMRSQENVISNDQISFDEIKNDAIDLSTELSFLESQKEIEIQNYTPVSLVLNSKDVDYLLKNIEIVYNSVEIILNNLFLGHDDELNNMFESVLNFLPLAKVKKITNSWQIFSRFDFYINQEGKVKFLELNTSCPGGYFTNPTFVKYAKKNLSKLIQSDIKNHLYENLSSFAKEMVFVESKSKISPGLVALLYDENNILFELESIKKSFESIQRQAVILDVKDLKLDSDGYLIYNDQRISMTYNKFRVGPCTKYTWKEGYLEKYKNFISAVQNEKVVSVNNFMTMVFSEDKGIFSVLTNEYFIKKYNLSNELKNILPWTRRLSEKTTMFQNNKIDLVSFIKSNRSNFVLKPAHSGRGFGVFIGADMDQIEWEQAIDSVNASIYIVQEYIESVFYDITYYDAQNDFLKKAPVYQTMSSYLLNSKFHGFGCRISEQKITNINKNGLVQPVILAH